MNSKNISDSLLTLEQGKELKENSLNESDFENLSKLELLQKLKESKAHSDIVEEDNKKLQNSVSNLEKALEDQCQKIKLLEDDKTFLRSNIKKASASWFERKARLSEGESDTSEKNDSESGDENCRETTKKDWAQIFVADEAIKLFSELKFKDEQIELSERRSSELKKRVNDYEKVIDDQEVVIHGLEKQLETYFHDNQKMCKQLADLHKLFADLETINDKQVNVSVTQQDSESTTDYLPTPEEFKEMSGSVTKTYIKLKELIYEKKSLVTEIERLRTLNVELQNRVSQQETRLISVSDALQTTWLLVSNLKDEHEKIHTAETILRYELKEKREILRKLRDELECSREQWHIIRQKNSETEQEWTNLREELNERRRLRKFAEINGSSELTSEEIEGAVGISKSPDHEFEPPIDLLVDMGIEYGVLEADDEESSTVIALIDGEDVHEERLQNLEEQCCFLYQKLMSSTGRALTLASRLTSLHQHYAMSDDEDDEEEDDNENEQYFDEDEDDDEGNAYESEVVSPDSESYDTAYVSEADGADTASVVADTTGLSNVIDSSITEIPGEESPELIDEGCDLLSRRLITFLPRKIEILKVENKKLEDRLQLQQEEKTKMEDRLNSSVEFERRQRKQLEQQLTHLGKCVDELKLERNGKIAKVEEELKNKIEQVEIEAKEHIQLREEFETLQEKYDERGDLLQLTASQLEKTVRESEEKLNELQNEMLNLKQEICIETNRTKSSVLNQKDEDLICDENEKIQEELKGAKMKIRSSPPKLNPNDLILKKNSSSEEISNSSKSMTENLTSMTSQFKKLILLTNSCLRIPFYLSVDSVLCWSFHVTPQELKFSITYDDVLHQDAGSLISVSTPEGESLEPRLQEGEAAINSQESDAPLVSQTKDDITQNTEEGAASEQLQHHKDDSTDSPQESYHPEEGSSFKLNNEIRISREVLPPYCVQSSISEVVGRLVPKVSGHYSLNFHNKIFESQDLFVKIWIENVSSAEEED